jgi:hypothetical protein
MKDDKDIILLGKIIIIVLIIIGTIVILSLVKYIFTTDKYGYDIPKEPDQTVDIENYQKLTSIDKIKYNQNISSKSFLTAINNSVTKYINNENEDLLQNEENLFKFVYSFAYEENNKTLTKEILDETANKLFNRSISSEILNNYLKDGDYFYDVNPNYDYCFKAYKVKTEKDAIYIKLGVVNYNAIICGSDYTDYNIDTFIKEAILIIDKKDNNYYINKLTFIEKESD